MTTASVWIGAGQRAGESAAAPEDLPLDMCDGRPAPIEGLRAEDAAGFLKALAHEGRLMILCHLAGGPRSVTELEKLLSTRQAMVSQHLARLRHEGLVTYRREGQAIFYAIADPKVLRTVALVAEMFRDPPEAT